MIVGNPSKTGSASNHMLIGHPHRGWPHERLVIESGREKARHQRIDRADIGFQRRKAVLAFSVKTVIEFDLGCAQVGLCQIAATNTYQCIRLFRSGGHDAAGPVIFEGPADKMDIVGKQGRGKRIPCKALTGFSVKGECHRLGAVHPTTRCKARDLWRGCFTEKTHQPFSFFARGALALAGLAAASAAVSRRQLAACAAFPALVFGRLPIG